jgi:hypothetical protein
MISIIGNLASPQSVSFSQETPSSGAFLAFDGVGGSGITIGGFGLVSGSSIGCGVGVYNGAILIIAASTSIKLNGFNTGVQVMRQSSLINDGNGFTMSGIIQYGAFVNMGSFANLQGSSITGISTVGSYGLASGGGSTIVVGSGTSISTFGQGINCSGYSQIFGATSVSWSNIGVLYTCDQYT